MRLRRLFWLVFLLCSIVPPLILSVFLITRSYNTEKNLVLRNLQTTAGVLSSSLINILEANRTDLVSTFEGPALQRALTYEKGLNQLDKESKEYLTKIFKARVRASKLVMGVSLMDSDGFVVAGSSERLIGSKAPLIGKSLKKAKESRSFYLTDTFYVPEIAKEPLYAMIMPLYDKDDFRGALGFSFSADFIQEMVDKAELTKKFKTRLITVVDRNNRIISTSDPDFYRGESLSNYLEISLPGPDPGLPQAENGTSKGPVPVHFKTISGNNTGYFTRIEENGWGLMLSMNEDEIMGPLRKMMLFNLLFTILVMIAVSLIFTRLSSCFSEPVMKLTEAMERYRSGDESARFDHRGDDEFGHIASAFNEMAETLNVILANEKIKSRYYEDKANIDQLSGILNKTATETLISGILDEAADSTSNALFIMDIDNFKSINDNYGHATGDRVIREFAAELKKTFREIDVSGRIGGDEFMVFLRYVEDIGIITEKAKQISEAAARASSAAEGMPDITVSIGCSRHPADGLTFSQLYEKADKALYTTKRNGKNGFTLYEKMI